MRESFPPWKLSSYSSQTFFLSSRKRNDPREGQALKEAKQDCARKQKLDFWSLCLLHDRVVE